jgi:hypothetical protein
MPIQQQVIHGMLVFFLQLLMVLDAAVDDFWG